MTYLNFLQKRLRAVARRVFPSDPEQCVYLTNMNKYTRLYLRRIVYSAGKDPFKLKITNQQLARLCCVPLKKFLLWFRHDYHLPKVFRRVRYFLREIIIMNIYEDRGDLYILRSDGSIERPVDRPSGRTMACWTQQMNPIREEHRNQGPPITNLSEAMEMIEWMQAGYSSSDSSESDCESIGVGEDPDEGRSVNEINSDTEESPALNGKLESLLNKL